MAATPPDERSVYLALRNVFVGADLHVRNIRKIREKIRAHDSIELVALIQESNIDNVSNVAKRLLEGDVFQSTLKAKLRFPELFDVSPAQSAARTVSGQEAAEAEEISLRRAAKLHQESCDTVKPCSQHPSVDEAAVARKPSRSETATCVPSLYPVYLPMSTQHLLMNELQTTLERTCYAFASIHMPHILKQKGWNCRECVELNAWPKIIMGLENKMSDDAVATVGKPMSDLLANIAQIRHTAVHRLPITVDRVEHFLVDAGSLANVLDQDVYGEMIARLRRKTEAVVEDVKRNKDLLEARSANVMRSVRRQQAELERELRTALDEMLQEDQDFQLIKGRALEEAIISPDNTCVNSQPDSSEEAEENDNALEQEKKIWKESESLVYGQGT